MYSRDPRRFRRVARFALAFAIAVLTPISALAQIDQGSILGAVTDANGASLYLNNDRRLINPAAFAIPLPG